MSLQEYDAAARAVGLRVRGGFHPGPSDSAPTGTQTLLMLGPDEPAFWPIFSTSPEYDDGKPDPLDRWSKRVLGALAADWQGKAIFPSDGPPYAPFVPWALATGLAWSSPIRLLVQAQTGLFISYRGAIALPMRLDLPEPQPSPCLTCPAPCATACPVRALGRDQEYDVPACMAHLRTPEGKDCLNGCLARKACPVRQDFRRDPAQSAFHMAAFLGE